MFFFIRILSVVVFYKKGKLQVLNCGWSFNVRVKTIGKPSTEVMTKRCTWPFKEVARFISVFYWQWFRDFTRTIKQRQNKRNSWFINYYGYKSKQAIYVAAKYTSEHYTFIYTSSP